MSNQKFEVTNPEAIKLLNDLKSGTYFAPITNFLKKYKWVFAGALTLFALLIAIQIGKVWSSRNTPIFTPPSISDVTPTTTKVVKSSFDNLKKSITNFSSTMPDPALPAVDNSISLEQSLE